MNAGDLMMVVKNNYYWLEDDSKAGFIANGDLIEIEKVFGYKDIYDFRFADVAVRLVDYPDEARYGSNCFSIPWNRKALRLPMMKIKNYSTTLWPIFPTFPNGGKKWNN